jgi:hypothetical protein
VNRPIFPLGQVEVRYIEKAHDERKNMDFLKYKIEYRNPGTGEPFELVVSNKTGEDGLKQGDKVEMFVGIGATEQGSLWFSLVSFSRAGGSGTKADKS